MPRSGENQYQFTIHTQRAAHKMRGPSECVCVWVYVCVCVYVSVCVCVYCNIGWSVLIMQEYALLTGADWAAMMGGVNMEFPLTCFFNTHTQAHTHTHTQTKERTRQKGEREMEVVREEASSGGRVTLTERAEERQV